MVITLLIFCSYCSSAYSQTKAERQEIVFALGVADVFDSNNYTGYGVEYRFRPTWQTLRPVIGYSSTIDHDEYIYVGGRYFFALDENWQFNPSFGIGLFDKGGDVDLGGSVEFRSSLEISYRINEHVHIGLELAHLSNSRLYKSNPGTETVSLSIAIKI